MKILHTADLHLDSPFVGNNLLNSDEKRENQRELLRRIFACAKEERCDLILIAGDLFDSSCVTAETERTLLGLLKQSDCPVIIAPGNHDPFEEGSFYRRANLPENVYVFSSTELQCFEFDSIRTRVFGYAFTAASLIKSPLAEATPPEKGNWNHLLCAHAELNTPLTRYCPLTEGDIRRFEIDYAALGHIHRPPSEEGTIRYSGFGEGRSFDETGDGGVLLITIEGNEPPVVARRILSRRRYVTRELDVTDYVGSAEIQTEILAICGEEGKRAGTNLRLTLVGAAEEDAVTEVLYMEKGAFPEIAALESLELKNLTVPYTDSASLSKDVGLRGAFYRELLPQLTSEDPAVRKKAVMAVKIGLAAIEGRTIPKGGGER